MVLPGLGTLVTGAAATGAGVAVATSDDQPVTSDRSDLLHGVGESIARNDDDPDGGGGNPPQYRAAAVEEYLFTPTAILAIVKSWGVATYNPPGTNCTSWLNRMHRTCERYGIPDVQRAPCAMHRLRADCKTAAHTSGCYDMTWGEFTAWLHQWDRKLDVLTHITLPC